MTSFVLPLLAALMLGSYSGASPVAQGDRKTNKPAHFVTLPTRLLAFGKPPHGSLPKHAKPSDRVRRLRAKRRELGVLAWRRRERA